MHMGYPSYDPMDLGQYTQPTSMQITLDLGHTYKPSQEPIYQTVPTKRDKVTLETVWTIAREIQAKMVKQDEWQDDIAQTAPVVMKTLAENIFALPRIQHYQLWGCGFHLETRIPGAWDIFQLEDHQHLFLQHYLPSSEKSPPASFTSDAGAAKEGPATFVKYLKELETVTKLLAEEVSGYSFRGRVFSMCSSKEVSGHTAPSQADQHWLCLWSGNLLSTTDDVH
ncbi:hypothetical protein PILCRDRAFT_14451 [Piloderma croceum F 1598]|uniref:Uncharacterized protein n=1 Tax=Piloderma croceum (strain F 1598) TaxID=765440 RepID=A0A0C3F2Y6_PILCF|nr:hypothetical protein PILCRDRAFT_14451 [Piloderma croceum F 1598]